MESIITAFELSQKATSILKEGERKPMSTTAAVEVNAIYSSKSQNANYLNRKSCPDCNVQHDRQNCKYLDFVCDKCHRRGHIQSVCLSNKKQNTRDRRRRKRDYSQNRQSNRSSSKHRHYQSRSHNNQNTSNKDFRETAHLIHEVQHEDICTLKESIGQCEESKKRLIVSLEVNKVPLDFQLDTGATCSLIGLQGYRNLGEPICATTDRVLRAYGNIKIPIKGMISAEIIWRGIVRRLPLLVVDSEYGSNIMGMDLFDAFDLSIKQQSEEKALHVSSDNSDKEQQQLALEAKTLCERYKSVFNSELGCSNSYVGHLVLKADAQPKFCKYRPVPFAQKEKVKAEIERLLKLGILRRIETSQWAAPIVPVQKANGSIRICGDFKQTINPQLIVNRHPLPRVLDIFHSLEGGCYFTKIDLSDAYLQIPLDEESQKICVISTEFGLFQYLRVPFGTASSTGIFQNYIEQLTTGLFGAAYVDDVIISGRSKGEHLDNLKTFLERLESHGLRCQKCEFAKSKIEYLGHIIDATGIRPSESRLLAIKDLPEPSNLKELEAFVGKINYYNQFIENFAQIAAPLNKLRSKNVKFIWGDEQRKVFQIFKEKLMSVSRLVHFQNDLPVSLATDASSHGIGAVISHIYPDGSEKPIAFASKTLTESQKRYSQIEKEALSIIFGIKKFHQYLFGRQFELITDHQPLVSIFNPSKKLPQMTIARLQRWAIILMSYSYTIRYRPTAQHANADCLSRLPIGPDEEFDNMDESCHTLDVYSSFIEDFPINSSTVAEHSKKDSILNKTEHPRVVVPRSLQPKVLSLLHEGHWGETRMKQLSRRYCWWPGIDEMIHHTVNECNACQLNASQPTKHYTSWPTTEHSWERIHIDYAGPFEKFMWLIIVDSFSKFPFVVRMQSTTSKATIGALRSVFALEGLPKTIVSDNGTQFSSAEFKNFCQENAITHLTSAPFNPESNGAAERMVRTFKTALTKILCTTLTLKISSDSITFTHVNEVNVKFCSSPMTHRWLES
ncbi:uncharacterized protein K02A2.6-like [Eupeodes corollae]|uniref:uncharacterized protein K02A2.6-like n=1 Tax=Eupeodes corollae TaxID=290404 RepID=UPI0024912115|nr:uncharacterized protein K02A2.6-like [Eupeodes corollae]